jgi:hypothetical protein
MTYIKAERSRGCLTEVAVSRFGTARGLSLTRERSHEPASRDARMQCAATWITPRNARSRQPVAARQQCRQSAAARAALPLHHPPATLAELQRDAIIALAKGSMGRGTPLSAFIPPSSEVPRYHSLRENDQ